MTHTKTTIIFLALLCPAGLKAQQKLNLDHVTVFLSGAELVSSGKVNLQKGGNEVLFTNVAGDINISSLAVSASNDVVVASARFKNNYVGGEVLSPAAKIIKDSIEVLKAEQSQLDTKIAVLKEEVSILNSNQKVSGDNTGLNVAELTQMLDMVNARMEGYLTQQKKEESILAKVTERLERFNKQLEVEKKKDYQPTGQIVVKLFAKEAATSDITVDYIVPRARWSPTYDIVADNNSSPLKMYYKANIYQNSGIKWDNVHLTLSTGNPQEGAQAPTLNPEYVSFYEPYAAKRKELTGSVSTVSAEALGERAPEWIIDGAAVMGGGSPNKDANSGVNNYVYVDNTGINTSFDIDLPYTIPSDGQQYEVAIKKYEVPATYRYYVIPKVDKDAFLQAEIINWQDLNLLPGKSNIFYEGTYVGAGNIDPRNTRDTMTLSLGRDKKIVVTRTQDTKLHSVKTIGTNQRETFAYTISIRNTHKENVNLTLQDQVPVSNDKDIAIEDKDTQGAEYDETTGALKWAISLNANEMKNISFGYTVKYPKGKMINNVR